MKNEQYNEILQISTKILEIAETALQENKNFNYFDYFFENYNKKSVEKFDINSVNFEEKAKFISAIFSLIEKSNESKNKAYTVTFTSCLVENDIQNQFYSVLKNTEFTEPILKNICEGEADLKQSSFSDIDSELNELITNIFTIWNKHRINDSISSLGQIPTVEKFVKKLDVDNKSKMFLDTFKSVAKKTTEKSDSIYKNSLKHIKSAIKEKEDTEIKTDSNPFEDIIDSEINNKLDKEPNEIMKEHNKLLKHYNYGIEPDDLKDNEKVNTIQNLIDKTKNTIDNSIKDKKYILPLEEILKNVNVDLIEYKEDYGKLNKERIDFFNSIVKDMSDIDIKDIEDSKVLEKVQFSKEKFKLDYQKNEDTINVFLVGKLTNIKFYSWEFTKEQYKNFLNPYELLYFVFSSLAPSTSDSKPSIPPLKAVSSGMVVKYLDRHSNTKIGYFEDDKYTSWRLLEICDDTIYLELFLN